MATAREIAEKMRKKKDEESVSTGSSAREVAERIKRYQTIDTNGVDQAYIDSFITDANTFLTTAEEDYGGVGWANASSSYDSRNSTWQDLNTRADTINAWLFKNRDSVDGETYKYLTDSLSSFRSSGSSIIDTFKNASDYYSRWKTEDEYNEWYEYRSALDSEDFDHYSQIGGSIKNPENIADVADSGLYIFGKRVFGKDGEDVGNVVTMSRDNADYIAIMEANGGDTADYGLKSIYRYMTDDEVGIYNYYLGKGETGKATQYLASLEDTLNQRFAGKIVENLKDKKSLEMLFAAVSGFEQASYGFRNLDNLFTGAKAEPLSAWQYAAPAVREDMDGLWGVAYDLTQTTANMVPSIMVGSLTGGIGGALTLGTSAMGNAYADMRRDGYDEWQSRGYAALVGASEATLSYFLGGISKLGGGSNGIFQTVTSKIVPKFDNAIARVAIQLGGNMLDEGLEEAIQEVLDPAFKALMTGEDFESPKWEDVWYSALLGALSAGFLEGAPTIAGTTIQSGQTAIDYGAMSISEGIDAFKKNHKIGDVVSAYKTGKNTLAENASALVSEALDIDPENAHAQRMQARLDKGKGVSGYQIDRLVEANEQALRTQDTAKMKSAVEARLAELGETGDISALAEVIVKARSGEKLTSAERTILTESKYGRRVSTEMNPDMMQTGEYSSAWAENIGTERINYDAYNRELLALANETAGVAVGGENTAVAEASAVAPIKTPTEEETATESKFKVSADGKARLGDTEVTIKEIASVKDGKVTLRLEDDSTVDAVDVEFGSDEEGLLYENVVEMGLNTTTANAFVNGYDGNIPVKEYAIGFRQAYRYGELGIPKSEMNAKGFSARLTASQKDLAYNHGAINAKYNAEKKQSASAKIASVSAKNTAKDASKGKKKGKLHNTLKPTNETQRASLKALGVLADLLNIDIYTFESPLVNGRRQGKNGWYDPVTRKMGIDLYAGIDGKGTMLFTGAHELTHDLREKLPTKFKVFADFLFKHYGEKGISVAELIERKKAILESNGRITPDMTEQEAYDLAYEEVVADACESFLADGSAIQKIAELKAKDRTLWQTIKDFINKLVARIKSAYKGLSPDSYEGKLVAEMLDTAEQLKAMWAELLVEASEVHSTAETTLGENGIVVDSNTESAVLYSVRDLLDNKEQQKVAEALAKRFGVTIEEARKWISAETSLASLILNPRYSQYLDYTPDPNEVAIKQNSDYPQGTVDFSPICAKRREFTSVMNNILRLFPNHVFAATDLAKIRSIMQEEGMTIPCGICYVEDRRQLDTIVAQNFIDSIGLYREGSKTRPDGKPFNANQLKALRLIGGDSYTPSVYELVSLEGLNILKAKNPNMAEAWVKFNNARGMQAVRLLANEAEYKRQILKYSKATVKSKNDKGGLRVYSFSDAEMFHLIDIIQVITDSATVGLALQGYTKVNEYAKAVKDTGEKLNRSLIPKGELGYHIEDGKVILDYDTVEGIDINHPDFFDNRDNPNVGNITIGVSDVQIRAAMVSDFVDQIIPFHTGQSEEVLGEKGISTWTNYKDFQTEKDIATGKVSDHQINIYTEVLQPLEKEGKPITKRTFVEKFLQVCKENNLIPRFSQFLNTNESGEYIYTEGYHKMLVDFKTFAQTEVGEYLPQMPVKPIFDNEYITKILKDYVESQKVKDAEIAESMPRVIERITNEIVKPGEVKFSDREVSEISDADYRKMCNHFGATKNYDVAGYMLQNGVMLDFSGKHWGDDYSTSRQVDHRDIQEILDDRGNNGINAMIDMIGNGNIRLMPEVGGINLAVMPNATQMSHLRGYINHFRGEVVIDIDKVGGDTIHSWEYTRGTSSAKILSDIKAYFDEGIIPKQKAKGETDIRQFLYSDRASADMATDFVLYMNKIVQNRGAWYRSDVHDYIGQNPELDFIGRIFNKDKTVKADLAQFLGTIEDTKTLHYLSWYMGEAYGDIAPRWGNNGRMVYPYRGAVRTFRNAIKNRINEIMTAKNGGTNLGVKNGEVSLSDIKELFFRLNGIEEMNELAEKVFATSEKIGVNIRFTNTMFSKKPSNGDALGDMVEFKTSYFNDTAITDQRKSQTILHELIHTCTAYVLAANQSTGNVHFGGFKSANYEMIANAATRINRIFGEVRLDSDLRGQYGTKNVREFVAELSNPEFVERLKGKTLWEKIVDWVCDLFGFKKGTSVYDNVRMCVDYILDNPDVEEYKAYAVNARRYAHAEHGGAFGSTVMTDGQVRYSDRVLMGSLFSGGGTLEAGLAYQMLDKEFGVEYDGKIASVYADNHGDHIQVGRVEDFDISKYEDIFYLHASPVCHNFSKAKHGATELQMDIDSAMATAKHLETAMPQVFTVENAPGYRKSQSLQIITDKLTQLGYKWDVDVYNSADYGSATSRNRVILRAVKDGELPAKPTKQKRTNSWDKVTRDLWDTLPKSYLRPSFISAIENTPSLPILDADGKVNVNKPLLILTTTSGHQVTYCWEGEICPTLTTKCGEAKLVMPDGNIYAVTPEFMGRIQGLPDDYKYPKAKTRAFTIIGNGIPTHLTKAVIGGVLDSAYEQTHDGQVLYSDRNNVGYHAGDLGKAEYYFSQGYGRGTGHFGTGTYFVGEEERIGIGEYGRRPHHAVDFSDYNLYKITDDEDGWKLHDHLRVIDGGVRQDFYERALEDELRFYPYVSVYDLATKKYKTESNTWEEAYIPAWKDIANERGIEYQSEEEWSKEKDIPTDDEWFADYYSEYLEKTVKEATEAVEEKYRRFRDAYFHLWLRFGKDDTNRALQKVISHQQEIDPESNRNPFNEKQRRADSLATVFMKALGYEGIDVRGTRLDNIEYGSVIYDLKEDTILYQERDTDSVSDRSLLAHALESVAQNDVERNKLAEYKAKIALIESEQARLAEIRARIKELSFAKGKRDTEAIRKLQFEAKQAENRINTYDRQLLNLEATKALKGVLEREKKMAYAKAEKRGKEALDAYREKATKTQRELLTRYQESRKKGIEGRHKTEMRYKIKKVVNELNEYLTKGTKEKHVPIQLQLPVAEALSAVNMDTVGAEERIAKKREEMRIAAAKGQIEKVEKLAKEIEHIQEMGGNLEAKLSRLQTAYDSIINSDDPLVANSHDDVISNTIAKVIEVVGDTPLRDMSLGQLEAVYDMYRMVLSSIRKANKAFKVAKGDEISTIANGVISELRDKKRKTPYSTKAMQAISAFDWNNLKPIYAFERIGSANFTKVFKSVLEGEGVWARDMREAEAFRDEQFGKYDYKSWDFEKKYEFASTSGEKFELTLGEIMSLYAYAKDKDAKNHLFGDGFAFDPKKEVVQKTKGGIKVTYNVEDATSYKLNEEILAKIVGVLDKIEGAKEFADAMQDYLSTVMGEKGNEVSLELYEIKLFKNKVYFPLKVSHAYMAIAKEKAKGEVKIKNKGFTKERTKKANNTVVLSSFMDVWANHVVEMSMYHAFTLPLEDFYRVYNYKAPGVGDFAPVSVNGELINSHGNAAVQYIEQLLTDLNGGARSDGREGLFSSAVSAFKKASVMASLSVVVQQPTAIVRAMALIDPKYFVGKKVSKGKHKAKWEEVKKYAPVAVIKEMGYFDTGMGKGSVEWLKGDKTWKDKVDDAISKAPALADEITWVAIWNAVKRETIRNHKDLSPTSEEFLKICGERFTEVIEKTQVYDSTLSRSANMRSKNLFMKMLTAFMAEPTTSINMLADAFRKAKTNKKYFARTLGAVYGSVVLNSVLVSLVYAMRDDDEDETFLEKYVSRLVTEIVDGINPLTYIPGVKDIWSAAQGFDVERADMSLITSVLDSFQQLVKVSSKDTSDMDEKELDEHYKAVAEAWMSVGDGITSLFGLPVKNFRRDINGFINFFETIGRGQETTAGSLADKVVGDLKDSIPIWGWLPNESKGDKLYDAIMKGDTAYVDRLKSQYKTDTAFSTAIRKALRDNESRIKEAAEYAIKGDSDGYNRLIEAVVAEGNFTKADVKAAVDAEIDAMTNNEMEYVYNEIVNGDIIMAYAMKEDIIRTAVGRGKTPDEAEKSFTNSLTSSVKKHYEEGDITDYEAMDILMNFGGKTAEEAEAKIQYWDFTNANPDTYVDDSWISEYYADGISDAGISIEMFVDYRNRVKGITGENKKRDRMAVINSLPLTSAQKDALYFAEGWTASKLWEAPWH